MQKTLESITWPPCFSTPNAKPHGSLYIRVFPLSMVNDCHRGLMCSRTVPIWPNLAKVLTMVMREPEPEFKYTTIQRNRSAVVSLQLLHHRVGLAQVLASLRILHDGVAARVC